MTKGQKKKVYTDEFKELMVKALLAGEKAKVLAEKNGLTTSMLYGWKDRLSGKAMKKGKKEIKEDLKKEKNIGAPVKAVVTYLKHAMDEMEKKHVRGRYRSLVELAYFTLIGE